MIYWLPANSKLYFCINDAGNPTMKSLASRIQRIHNANVLEMNKIIQSAKCGNHVIETKHKLIFLN